MKKISPMILSVIFLLSLNLAGCNNNSGTKIPNKAIGTIKFTDGGWDSIRVHNEIARIIIENGYGYKTETIKGSESASLSALSAGSMDVFMEIWTETYKEQYNSAIENGDIIEASVNFDDTRQGLYVPTYVIKGDPKRGIKPLAPDLKTIYDLPKYWEIFKDPDNPKKGRIYGAAPIWNSNKVFQQKMKSYELDKYFIYIQPVSDEALNESFIHAYESGEPWVGYQWEPTWIAGMYDITELKDEPYNEEEWNNGYRTEFPSQRLTIAVHNKLPKQVPEVFEFLSHYKTTSTITTELLVYMKKYDAKPNEAAIWFLKEYEEVWTTWVPSTISKRVKERLG